MKIGPIVFRCLPAGVLLVASCIFSGCEIAATRVVFSKAMINGQPVQMVLDTGGASASLSSSEVASLGLKSTPVPHYTINSYGTLALTEPVTLTVGTETYTTPLEVTPHPGFGHTMDGAIGWPEVRDNILVFDGTARTVSTVAELPPETAGWLKLKVHPGHMLLLEMPLPDGTVGNILVDTGSPSGLSLPAAQWQVWSAAHPKAYLGAVQVRVSGGDTESIGVAAADEAKLGSLTLTDVRVERETALEASYANAGELGIYALARMNLIVDGKNGFAYLHPKPPLGPLESGKTDSWVASLLGPYTDPTGKTNWTVADNVRLNVDPDFAFSAYRDAMTKFDQGDYDGAIADDTKAIQLDPINADYYDDRGDAENSKGDHDGAIVDYTKALELDPKNARLYNHRGNAKRFKGDYDSAIADFDQALELDPKNGDIYYFNRGMAKYLKRDFGGAATDFSQAIELDPKDADNYCYRGWAEEGNGDHDVAIADFNQALNLDPKNGKACDGRGQAKNSKGDYDGAIADFSHALEIDPKIAALYDDRGEAKFAKGDQDGAIADYTEAIDLDPKDADFYDDRGEAKGSRGDYNGAIADINHAIELDPKDAANYKSLGVVKQIQGDSAAALADYDKAIKTEPGNSPYSHLYRQLLLMKLGKAPADFAQTVAGWKDGWTKTLGQFVTGKLDEAALLAASEKSGGELVIGQQCKAYYFIGLMRLLKGDQTGAQEFFNKCLATGRKNCSEYQFARAELAHMDSEKKK